MFPIYKDIDRTQLIVDRRQYGTANLFGIIAYTDANPNIKRLLRDADEWNNIDYISCGWIIYAIQPEYGQRVAFSKDDESGRRPYGNFEFNYDFLQDFGIDSSEWFPMLIVCALAKDDKIESIRIPIDDSSKEAAAASIQEAVKDVTATLKKVEVPDKDSTQVLREVEKALKAKRVKTSLNKASRAFMEFFFGFSIPLKSV